MAEGGGGALRELLAVFEIKVSDEELEAAGKKIESFKGRLTEIAKFVAEAFAVDAIKEFVESQVEAATELERTSQRLGLTTEQLQQYDFAAGLAGVQTESFSTGLRFLSRNIGEAVLKGGDAAATFQRLGVHLKNTDGTTRGTGEVLEDLADKFKDIPDAAKRTQIAMELFGRQGAALIPILDKGSEAFAEARREMDALGGPTSKEVIEGAKKIEEAQVKLNFALSSVKSTIALALFPAFQKMIELGTEVVKHVADVTKNTYALTTALDVLGVVAGYKALSGLGTLLKAFGLLKPSILETVAALLEFAAPAIIIGVLYLVFDDLYTLMEGGQSVIGETIDQLFGVGAAASAIQFVNDAITVGTDLFEGLASIIAGGVVPVFVTLWEIVKGVAKTLFDIVSLDFGSIGKDLASAAGNIADAWKAGGKTIAGGAAQVFGFGPDAHPFTPGPSRGFGGTIGANPNAPEREPQGFAFGPQKGHVREPIAVHIERGGGQAHTGPLVHQQITNHIDVHTSSDEPRAIGEAVGQGVATPAQRATSNALQTVRKT